MSALLVNPTQDFAPASQALSLDELTKVRRGWVAFHMIERFDGATQETLGTYLRRVEDSDEDLFSQSAVKSAPRSWREL